MEKNALRFLLSRIPTHLYAVPFLWAWFTDELIEVNVCIYARCYGLHFHSIIISISSNNSIISSSSITKALSSIA